MISFLTLVLAAIGAFSACEPLRKMVMSLYDTVKGWCTKAD